MGLSYALRDAIPLIRMVAKMRKIGFHIHGDIPKVTWKVFEDNSGALEMAQTHKYRPRTKHINVKMHHFRDYVTRGEITLHPISTLDQIADFLTKPVNESILKKLRIRILGW